MPAEEVLPLRARDGVVLLFRARPAAGARGAVLLVHGFAEHSGRYGHVRARLARAGFSCFGFDLRGHGFSRGRRGHVRGFGDYFADVDAALAAARARAGALPLFLLGHSLGGLIAAGYAIERRPRLAGLVLASPALAFRARVPAWLRALARVLAVAWPTFARPAGIDLERLSHDPAVAAAARADPLRFATATARWYVASVGAQRTVRARAGEIAVPALVLVAGDDALVDPGAALRLHDRLGAGAALRRYDGCYHELFNEVERERVLDDVEAWLAERCAEAGGS